MSKEFEPSTTFVESEKQGKGEIKTFELDDLLSGTSEKNRGFVYESENARNFDQANVSKAKQGVKELMANVVAKAKALAIDIKNEARKEGYQDGYDAGFKKGEDAAKSEFSPFLETINNLIEELSGFRKMMYNKAEKEMIEMVVDLAKKVLHHELRTKEDSVQQMILLAMNSVLDKENMTIRIHPSDKGYAETFRPELHHLFGEIKNITFEAHSGIERGGCVIESNFGVVDARIDQMDEQIDKILSLAPPVLDNEESTPSASVEPSETPTEESAPTAEEVPEIASEETSQPASEEAIETISEEPSQSASEETSETPSEESAESTQGDDAPPASE